MVNTDDIVSDGDGVLPDLQQEEIGGNVFKKLAKARFELAGKEIKKTGTGQYNYLELSDFLPICHEIFEKLGLCACLEFTGDFARLVIRDVDHPSSVAIFTTPVVAAQLVKGDPIKCLGATQTYIRRYLWLQAMEISIPDEVDKSPPKPFAGINVPNPAMSGGGMRTMETMPDDLPLPTIEERIEQIKRIANIAMLESYYKSLPIEARGTVAIVEEVKKRKQELSPQGKI